MTCSSSTSAGSTARVTGTTGAGSPPPGATVRGRRSTVASARSSRPPAATSAVSPSSTNAPEASRWVRSTSGHSQATLVGVVDGLQLGAGVQQLTALQPHVDIGERLGAGVGQLALDGDRRARQQRARVQAGEPDADRVVVGGRLGGGGVPGSGRCDRGERDERGAEQPGQRDGDRRPPGRAAAAPHGGPAGDRPPPHDSSSPTLLATGPPAVSAGEPGSSLT